MLKLFATVLALIALCLNASAQTQSKWEGYNPPGCMESGIAVWPYGDTIYPASYILLQCLGTDQEIIKGLNAKYHVYLKNGNDTLNLLVIDINDGKSNITTTLLKPANPLQAGKEYVMHIDNDSIRKPVFPGQGFGANDFNYEDKYDPNLKELKEKRWYISATLPDTTPIIWQQKPTELHRYNGLLQGTHEMINFSMGAIKFSYKLTDADGCLFKVRLTNITEQTESFVYVSPTDTTFILGRGNTCFGNFKFDKHTGYKAAFNVLDKFGKEHKWKGKEISFVSPD